MRPRLVGPALRRTPSWLLHVNDGSIAFPITNFSGLPPEIPFDKKTDVGDIGAQNLAQTSALNQMKIKLGMYGELSKARLSALVVVTSGAGYGAGCDVIDPCAVVSLFVGTSLAAGWFRNRCDFK
jgi:hypothetical protein